MVMLGVFTSILRILGHRLYRLVCLLWIGWGVSLCAVASDFLPPILSYDAVSYGAGTQNWSCMQDARGYLYFGNNDGLLRFDGYRWRLFPVPGNHIVRSVAVEGDRIYVGSYEEFGYFEGDTRGEMRYVSLSDSLRGFSMHDDEIWTIHPCGGKVYFQSFRSWFVYDGKEVKGYAPDTHQPLFFYKVGKEIYVQVIRGDFCRLEGDSLVPICSKESLGGDQVMGAISLSGGRMILATENNGLFVLQQGEAPIPIRTEIDESLRSQRVNRVIMMQDSTLVIGTVFNGVYAIDTLGKKLWHYNMDNHLPNNTVLGLCSDAENNVWVAMDEGIASIRHGSPLRIMTPTLSEPKIGMVYGILREGGDYLFATNQSAYVRRGETGRLEQIHGTEGQNWYVKNVDGQVFVGNNYHLIELERGSWSPHPYPGTNSSTDLLATRIHGEEVLVESSYSDVRVYRKQGNEWVYAHRVKGFMAPLMRIEADADGTLWASHMYQGIYALTVTPDLSAIETLRRFDRLGEEDIEGVAPVLKIRGRIVFCTEKSFYTYDDIKREIIPYEPLNEILPYIGKAVYICPVSDTDYWVAGVMSAVRVNFKDGKYKVVEHIATHPDPSRVKPNYNILYHDGESLYFNLNNGVASYRGRKWNVSTPELTLQRVLGVDDALDEIVLDLDAGELKTGMRDLTFEFAFPVYGRSGIHFKYELDGPSTHAVRESKIPEVQFSSLRYGSYRLKATVYDELNNLLKEKELNFTVTPPFYASLPAIFLYLCLTGLGVYLLLKWRTRRAVRKREKELESERLKQRIRIEEQERLISSQRQELLEHEITGKSKELANMALYVTSKNQSLIRVRDEMREALREGTPGRRKMQELLRSIEADIDDEDFWEVLEHNFDLVHEKFFRTLRTKYPQLTPNDLKLCALLRMNLSTKDIAKLSNLTVRGVEAARYRLRKKLDIHEGENLIDFLIDIR